MITKTAERQRKHWQKI